MEKIKKMIFPTIIHCQELPQWITSSDYAAYCPTIRTIYLRHGEEIWVLFHEIGHHIIELLGCNSTIQRAYDKLTLWVMNLLGDEKTD